MYIGGIFSRIIFFFPRSFTSLVLCLLVYCSGVAGNLAYATRLGLWGPHAPFGSFKEFKESMEKRGLGALEMLAMELKAKGSYVSRGLGWKGAEFETCEVIVCAISHCPVSASFYMSVTVGLW